MQQWFTKEEKTELTKKNEMKRKAFHFQAPKKKNE
jgi:hypothetical protein